MSMVLYESSLANDSHPVNLTLTLTHSLPWLITLPHPLPLQMTLTGSTAKPEYMGVYERSEKTAHGAPVFVKKAGGTAPLGLTTCTATLMGSGR